MNGLNVVAVTHLPAGKVGLLIGGGSGHEPLFAGFVGVNMADGAVAGIFAAPTPDLILEGTRALDQGNGVLYLYGNYPGDNMNFDLAAELAAEEGSKPGQWRRLGRRGFGAARADRGPARDLETYSSLRLPGEFLLRPPIWRRCTG